MKEFHIKDIKVIDKEVSPEKLLTGEYIKGLSGNSSILPNAELEEDEYVKFPDQTVQQVEGAPHEKGGVKMNIPGETEVLSDHLTLNKANIKRLEKEFGLNLTLKTTYAEAVEKYTKLIGLEKLNNEQEDFFKALKKEMDKPSDKNTARINFEWITGKIKSIEDKKVALKEKRKNFFDIVFDMQEQSKPKEKSKESEFKNGGVHDKNFEALCNKMGISVEQGMSYLKEGGKYLKELPVYQDGIFLPSDKKIPTGESLTDVQKDQLLKYYRKHNPQLANAIDNGKIKWGEITLNPGLVQEATQQGFLEGVPVYEQSRDASNLLPNAKTYGNLSQERVQGFLLKDYYEATHPGKKFEDITPEEVGSLQEDYNKALANTPFGSYYSGVKGEKEVSDKYFGNRTSSYVRAVGQVKGTKAGTIDVDKLFSQSPEAIDAALKDYGLTYKDIEPYKNAAYKYIKIGDGETVPPAEGDQPTQPGEKTTGNAGTPIVDNVDVPAPKNDYPRLFFTPDQSVLPPSPMEAHLKGDIRLERIDPIKVGVENNIRELALNKEFITKQLDNLPAAQRAAVLANLSASSNSAINAAISGANVTNAQNESQAELFNIGQSSQEQLYGVNNALSFEQRQFTAKAKTEESLRRYYGFNRKVEMNNFQEQQKLNLLSSLFPDYKLDFMGASVSYDPNSKFQIQDRSNLLEFLNMTGNTGTET